MSLWLLLILWPIASITFGLLVGWIVERRDRRGRR